MLSVYTADRIEAGLVLHFPMNTAPSGGVTESIRFPEIMSNNLQKILNIFPLLDFEIDKDTFLNFNNVLSSC